jgi:hypothetical protein
LQLFGHVAFISVAILILFGLSAPALLGLCAAKPLRGRSHAVDLREDSLLAIEQAIKLISSEQKPRISQT